MAEVVIVATVRTPICKAFRGAFNEKPGQTLAGHAIGAGVARAAIDPGAVDEVVVGCCWRRTASPSTILTRGNLIRRLPGDDVHGRRGPIRDFPMGSSRLTDIGSRLSM